MTYYMQHVCIEALPLELQMSYIFILLSKCLTAWLLVPITLVRRCIEKHEGKYIEVPHAIDSGEEGTVHLNRVATPVPVTLIHLLTHNENHANEHQYTMTYHVETDLADN